MLVQGDAEAPDEVVTSSPDGEAMLRRVFERQPAGRGYSANPISRFIFDWYYMRLMIFVRPRRIVWWPGGDFFGPRRSLECADVA